MPPQTSTPQHARAGERGVFRTILCGLDGAPASLEAVRQAAVLCTPGGRIRLVAVSEARADADVLGRWRADTGLSQARTLLAGYRVDVTSSEVPAEDAVAALIARGAGCDLIAVGARGLAAGKRDALGPTTRSLLAQSDVSVLIARPTPHDSFGASILLAVDGSAGSLVAADAAARIAERTGGRVAIVAAPAHDSTTRRTIAESAARLRRCTGTDPVILDENGAPARAVAAAAASVDASLVVTGSRGPGVADSVSQRIAAAAGCSVLVVRPA